MSTRFTKSIIKSCAALSYVEAQARMDDRFVLGRGTHIYCCFFFCICPLLLSWMFENIWILTFYISAYMAFHIPH